MGEFWEYIKAVVNQWQALGTGGVITFAVGWWEKLKRPLSKKIYTILVGGVFLFLASFFAWQEERTKVTQLDRALAQAQQLPPLPPDYITLHRPWLNTELVVSDFRDASFKLSYEITNIGKLPAESMRLVFASPHMSNFSQNSEITPFFIAPGASITFEPNYPLRFETQHLGLFSFFTLAIDYQTTIAGTKRSFRSAFEVNVKTDEIKEGRLRPSGVFNAEGQFTNQAIRTLLRTPFVR